MGYYINEDSNGYKLGSIGKYEALILDGGFPAGPEWQENLVCIVDNGTFEAAGYAFSPEEFEVMNSPDGRPKKWLTHPMAKKLSHFDE